MNNNKKIKLVSKSFIKQIEIHRNNIAKERDALRDLISDGQDLLNLSTEGCELLEEAIALGQRNQMRRG